MINVLIVEDDPMARQLLEIYINTSERYNHVQSVESAALAEFCCRTNDVDVILMDVCTAMNASGLEAAEKIKKSFPDIRIIIITSQPECSFLEKAHCAGVDSFWYKSSKAEEILSVMDRTMAGESVYPESTPSLRLGDTFSDSLSGRELEVLRELVAGESDAAIAEKLFMSVRTVKAHIHSMKEKTGFRNRTELAVRARESGLVIYSKK
ncbi:MAG: response regulator transcription factor [Anaerovoracaceae bacterium]|nr:response regulator transcription factor [Anaerovoracaceae bacterium]